jgi:hypothetical protein
VNHSGHGQAREGRRRGHRARLSRSWHAQAPDLPDPGTSPTFPADSAAGGRRNIGFGAAESVKLPVFSRNRPVCQPESTKKPNWAPNIGGFTDLVDGSRPRYRHPFPERVPKRSISTRNVGFPDVSGRSGSWRPGKPLERPDTSWPWSSRTPAALARAYPGLGKAAHELLRGRCAGPTTSWSAPAPSGLRKGRNRSTLSDIGKIRNRRPENRPDVVP